MPGPPGAQQTLPAGAESGGECPQSRDPGHHPPRGRQDGDRQGEDRDHLIIVIRARAEISLVSIMVIILGDAGERCEEVRG